MSAKLELREGPAGKRAYTRVAVGLKNRQNATKPTRATHNQSKVIRSTLTVGTIQRQSYRIALRQTMDTFASRSTGVHGVIDCAVELRNSHVPAHAGPHGLGGQRRAA